MFFILRSSYVGNTAVLAALLNFFPLPGFCFTLISRECREMRANPQLLRSLVVGAGNVKDVVFRALRPKGPLDRQDEIDGTCLEGLVFQHLTAWNDYGGRKNRLFFWRTKGGVEVDFVIYGPDCFHAIEVKNAAKITRRDASGLFAA